jgi:amidase
MQRVNRTLAAFHQDYDLLLSSTMAKPPAKVGELYPSSADHAQMALLRILGFKSLLDFTIEKLGTDTLAWTPNTQLFNQTGQPAASLPLFEHEGLPIGVQLSAAFGDEATLFRISAQLEQARPWAGKRPPSVK